MRCELEQKFENSTLITNSCGPHRLNLLGQDIKPSSIMKHIVDIHKWGSQLTCLAIFIQNHTSYVKITKEHYEEKDQYIVAHIQDFNLYRQVKDLIRQLKPVASALTHLESDSATVADACHIWSELLNYNE
ncbi:hypothetical protein NPIL_239741 [Nephila pilipes]|nr:hypothetical protein NPIL_239741 [Nephila pilipes]